MKAWTLFRGAAIAAGVMLAGGVLRAEIVQITGEFPADNREASFLESLHVERFSGQDGPALALAIERAMTGTTPFELVGGRAGRNSAEGSMSGAVSTGVDENSYRRKDKKCVERNDKDKCVKEEEVEIECRRRVVNFNADLRIVRNTDGRIVYSKSFPVRDEISWCRGQSPARTVEDSVSGAINGIAASVRREVSPSIETYRIRLRESTKGLPKDAAKGFKALIKSSQRDLAGACRGWEAMNQAVSGHPSVLFDLGLCAEQRGEYEKAVALYRQAQGAGAQEGAGAAGRAQRLIAGREDAKERAKRRRRG